jgi:signal transduction histidine kinase/DNA-binding response OmpR family regulator
VIRSLGIDDEGKIYVGALDDFGYLDKGKNGGYRYVSLSDKVESHLRSMGNVWQTLIQHDKVYFETESGLFLWDGQRVKFQPWPDPDAYHLCFLWKEKVYLQEEGKGLMVLSENNFSLATGGEYFASKRIYNVLPLANGTLQLATQYDGLFLYDGQKTKPFATQADAFFRTNQIYCGAILPDSSFVYGTRLGGAVIVDQNGTVRYLINDKTGLPTNIALGLTVDKDGNIWFSLDNGISKFEISNGMSSFNIKNGLEGAVNSFCRYEGKLYVATNSGLYSLEPGSLPETPPSFQKIGAINRSCFRLITVGDRMLVTSSDGLFEVIGEKVQLIDESSAYAIHRYQEDDTRVVVGFGDQLKSFKLVNGRWRRMGEVGHIKIDVVDFQENHSGQVWMTSYSQGAGLLSFPKQNGMTNYDKPSVKFFGSEAGLLEGSVTANLVNGEEIFQIGPQQRIFKFNYSAALFEEAPAFISNLGLNEKNIFPVSDDDQSGRFFFRTMPDDETKQEIILLEPGDGSSLVTRRFDISRISDHVHIHFYQDGNTLWFGGADGIVRFEMPSVKQPDTTFHTYINKIILMDDSIFLEGINNVQQNFTFPYTSNSFRFEFTSTNFVAEDRNEFQFKLDGYDESWSDWTTENIKEYARLWEGTYTFRVRSRNYAQQTGSTAQFVFTVAAPWYRSWYAYMTYLIIVTAIVWTFVRWRLRNVLEEKKALQAEIDHQTKEIRQQNARLEEQSEELRLNAEQLKELDKLKSNFFINISHEFRTPLSLILGPLEKAIQEKELAKIRFAELERMHRNASRLQQLINQLLDLAKLESGGMKLNITQSDFLYFLRVVVSSFESLADARNIQFSVDIPTGSYLTFFDVDKLETVLYNLLSNAFKFTPDGGRISLTVVPVEIDHFMSISIADSGPGISEPDLKKIFDRFYQVDSSSSREFEGSGIGLSLVKELVHLMDGTIEVQSILGQGATFTVRLPLKHLPQNSDQVLTGPEMHFQSDEPRGDNLPAFDGNNLTDRPLVLVVEDNADMRAFLSETLEDEYRVELAENGKDALIKALDLVPDIIISDMMMPVMDGFTLCAEIRSDERTSHIPFVLLTARSTIESKLEGLELGADEYIVKPFNSKELRVRVKNLLEQRKQLRKSFGREVTVQPKNISITSVDERFLNHAIEVMEAHLSNEQFSVERFAEEMGMSRKNLLRKIKGLTDQSVNEFIRNFRLKRAAQLLSANAASISEIAYKVGFNNLSYFSKCFKELFGVAPNEYKGQGFVQTE